MTTTIDKNDGKMASNNPGESKSSSMGTSPTDCPPPVGKDAKEIAAGIVTMAKQNGVALGVVSKDAATTPLTKNNQSNAKVVTVGKSETKKKVELTSDVVGGGGRAGANNDIAAASSSEGTPVNGTAMNNGFHHNINTSPFAVNNQQQRDQALWSLLQYLKADMDHKKECYGKSEAAAERCLILHHALHATFSTFSGHLKHWAATNPNYGIAVHAEMMTHFNPINHQMSNDYHLARQTAAEAYRAAQIAENFLKLFIQEHFTALGGTAIGAGDKRDESPTSVQEPAAKKMRVSPDNEEESKAREEEEAKLAQTV